MGHPLRPFRYLTLLFLCALLAPTVALEARDTIAKLEARLAKVKKPAERAQITARLADLQLEEIAAAYYNGRHDTGKAELDKLLTRIEDAQRELQTIPANSRRKPKGFKELEISVRESIRQLRDLATSLSFTEREPVEAAVQRLDKVENYLLNALFETMPSKETRKKP